MLYRVTKNIKIGFTTKEINYRLKQLQTGNENKLELIFYINGTHKIEKKLHKKFVNLKLEGEWFKESQEIYDYINQVN